MCHIKKFLNSLLVGFSERKEQMYTVTLHTLEASTHDITSWQEEVIKVVICTPQLVHQYVDAINRVTD